MILRDHIKRYVGSELTTHFIYVLALVLIGGNMIALAPFICLSGFSGIGECFSRLIQGYRIKFGTI